jgi:hypothetical protein
LTISARCCITLRVLFDNIGHVPATKVGIKVHVQRFTFAALPMESNRYGFANLSEIPPSGFKTVIDVPLQNFTQKDVELIRSGQQKLLLIFFISYDNGFETTGLDHPLEGPTLTMFNFHYVPLPHERWENTILLHYDDLREQEIKRREEERKKEESANEDITEKK